MTKRRRSCLGMTVEGNPRTRRAAAVGKEFARLRKRALKAIEAAGREGLTREKLAAAISAGRTGTKSIIDNLKGERKIHVIAWSFGHPAYGFGDHPDVPKPQAIPRGKRCAPDCLEIAKKEVQVAHAKWAETWIPHPDPAAAWIGSAA